jgi:hypothetical protein
MQQILAAQQIPARIIDLGLSSYLGSGSATALQVLPEHQQTASLLISPIEEQNLSAK